MYYTGINPLDMKPVYVATDYHEKQLQRALLQYNRPQNADLVREALVKAGREDLIGFGEECLVRPAGGKGNYAPKNGGNRLSAPKNQSRGAKNGSNSPKKQFAPGSRSTQNAKNGAKTDRTPTQKPQKPTYKAGWAKPKAKSGGKKK